MFLMTVSFVMRTSSLYFALLLSLLLILSESGCSDESSESCSGADCPGAVDADEIRLRDRQLYTCQDNQTPTSLGLALERCVGMNNCA